MIEDKLSKLHESIPEFSDTNKVKNNILKKYNNKATKKQKPIFRLAYISIPLVFLVVLIAFGAILIPLEIGSSNQQTEYEIRQNELSKLYLSGSKNYYSDYLESLEENIDEDYKSDYIKDLVEQNNKQEEQTVTEDVYFEVTIDYANGSSPVVIVVKKGELVYPEVFSRSGYYFLGWFIDGVELTSAIRIEKDTRIYAKWSVKKQVTIDGNYYEYYEDLDGAVIVNSKVLDTETLVIPSKLNGLDVVRLEAYSFNGAYSNNHNITKKLIIPDSVKEIKAVAISDYYILEEVYLPKNLEVLYSNALLDCPLLESIYIEDNPYFQVIDNMLIDKRSNTLLKGTVNSNTIPDGIITIEARAFSGYKTLKEINIPDSVEVIKSDAFKGCTSLKNIRLPEKLQEISSGVFNDCKNLEFVYIGKNVTKIHDLSFRGCNNLKSIIVDSENRVLYSTDSCLINRTTQTLVVGFNVESGIVNIPDGIKVIAHSAFYGRTTIKEVYFSDSVEIIEYSAFSECPNLEYVKINENLKEFEGFTFDSCIRLKEVVMPSSVEHLGQYIFRRCESLETIVMPSGVNTIPSGMFSGCINLKNIELKSIITTIESNAFNNCNKLESFDLSNTKKIGNDAFGFCRSLTSIDLGSAVEIGDRAFNYCMGLRNIYIPKTVISIGSLSFGNLRNSIVYCADKSIKSTWALDFCSGTECIFNSSLVLTYLDFVFVVINNNELKLTKYLGDEIEIIIPSELNGMKVTTIGEKAFYMKNAEKITIPSTVKLIDNNAFSYCESLKHIEIPSSVKEIQKYAFYNCTSLTSITLNEGLEILGASAFARCNLSTAIIPSTLKVCGGSIFNDNMHFLELINLSRIKYGFGNRIINTFDGLHYPSGVFTVDEDFLFCFDYTNGVINFVAYTGDDTFIELPSNVSFTVNDQVYETYIIRDSAFSYNQRIVKVVIPEGVTEIGDRAFFACFNLTSLTIPSTVTKIGDSVVVNDEHLFEIYNLSSLSNNDITKSSLTFYAKEVHTSLSVPSKVIKADNGLIYYVGGMGNNYIVGYDYVSEHLVLPSHINNEPYIIANHVFNDNLTIKTVVLPEGITEIQRNAFGDCENIKELVIPSSVTKIKWYAFYSMGSLEKVTFVDKTPWIIKTSSNPVSYKEIDVTDPYASANALQRNYMYDWNKNK